MWTKPLILAIVLVLLITVTGAVFADNQQGSSAAPTNTNVVYETNSFDTNSQLTNSDQVTQSAADAPSAGSPGLPASDDQSSFAQQPIDHTFWYLTRATALTGYVLLFVNVCLGLGIRVNFLDDLLARWRVLNLHEFTSFLGLGFVGIHMASLLGDQYMNFTVPQVLVPFTSPYRMPWVTLGVIAFYLMVAITISCYIRRRLSERTWRLLHYAGYGAFAMAMVHGVLAGSDTDQPWAAALYWGTGTVVAILTLGRIWGPIGRWFQNNWA